MDQAVKELNSEKCRRPKKTKRRLPKPVSRYIASKVNMVMVMEGKKDKFSREWGGHDAQTYMKVDPTSEQRLMEFVKRNAAGEIMCSYTSATN